MQWLNLRNVEDQDQPLASMLNNTCQSVTSAMSGSACAFWRSIHREPGTTAWCFLTFIYFSYFYLHFGISFHATSGTLTSYFSPLYPFDTRVTYSLRKRSNSPYSVVSAVRLALLYVMTFFDSLFIFPWMRALRGLIVETQILLLLSSSRTSFCFSLVCSNSGEQTMLVSLKARTSSNNSIALVIYPHFKGNDYSSL